MTKGLF